MKGFLDKDTRRGDPYRDTGHDYPRRTRLFARRILQEVQGSFNTLRKQQRNTSKTCLAQRREPVSYEYQRAAGVKMGVYVGIAFRA